MAHQNGQFPHPSARYFLKLPILLLFFTCIILFVVMNLLFSSSPRHTEIASVFQADRKNSSKEKSRLENGNHPNFALKNLKCVRKMRKKVSECLLKRIDAARNFWHELNPAIDECCGSLIKRVPFIKIENTGDYKFIILPSRRVKVPLENETCNLLTIGELCTYIFMSIKNNHSNKNFNL